MRTALPKKWLYGHRWRLSEFETSSSSPSYSSSSSPSDSSRATESISGDSTHSEQDSSKMPDASIDHSLVGSRTSEHVEPSNRTKETTVEDKRYDDKSDEDGCTTELRKRFYKKQDLKTEDVRITSYGVINEFKGDIPRSIPLSFNSRSAMDIVYSPYSNIHSSFIHPSSTAPEISHPIDYRVCNNSFTPAGGVIQHQGTSELHRDFICNICGKSFAVKENLTVHKRTHTREKPYPCEVCGRAFEHSGKLNRHLRIHTGERPHRCTVCGKSFVQSGQLVIHMRAHTGEKPYGCETCGKAFTCSKQLKVHRRTHTGEKPYKCDICGKAFGYNHVLKTHKNSHYGQRLYKCRLCQATFTSKKLMEQHLVECKNSGRNDSSDNNSQTHKTENSHENFTEIPYIPHVTKLQRRLLGVDSVSDERGSDQICSTSISDYRTPLHWIEKPPSVDSSILRAASNFSQIRNTVITPFAAPHLGLYSSPATNDSLDSTKLSTSWSSGDSEAPCETTPPKAVDIEYGGSFSFCVPDKRRDLASGTEWSLGKYNFPPNYGPSAFSLFPSPPPALPLISFPGHSSHQLSKTKNYSQFLDGLFKEKISLILNHLIGSDNLRLLGRPGCDIDLILEKVILQLGGAPCSTSSNHSHSDSLRDKMVCNMRTVLSRCTFDEHKYAWLQQAGDDLDVENIVERLYQQCGNQNKLEYQKQRVSYDPKSFEDTGSLQYPQSHSNSPPISSDFAFSLVGNTPEVETSCEQTTCEPEMQVAA